ncbi:hypothetical protein H0H92_010511 [Tricholoma furcatifolium]|nr:hypothetical protein H0H92_010511 [Tricholoma furcatifolium]
MRWGKYWHEYLLLVLVVAINGPRWFWYTNATSTPHAVTGAGWTTQRKLETRERVRELWYHGFDNYMIYAFPMDELTPLSCNGQGPDWGNPLNIASNDVAGNFSLTLIDVLDTLVVLGDREGFEQAVKNIINWVSFDVNTKPQVFETTIRVMGGLLSGHIFANQTGQPFHLPWYRGELLEMARDLGERLLPAFKTPTGLPYARINLRHGVPKGETLETCTAGAGSLILEFATLSRLTGDDRFEKAAHKARFAFFALWNRKSDIGLVGNTINTWTGMWTSPEITGIGAGVDSFYEYALKWYILSGDVEYLDVWEEAYAAVMRFSRASDGFWIIIYGEPIQDYQRFTTRISNKLPLTNTLCGPVSATACYKRTFPLTALLEFIESTWYLYRATKDPFYLDVGERVLFDLVTRSKVDCGLTGIQDLRTNKRDDRMESFALSETLKYLYLLFDEENPLHSDDSNYVFTTEGHILYLDQTHLKPMSASRRKMRHIDNHQCPVYQPFTSHNQRNGLVKGIQSRPDYEYARSLVGLMPPQKDIDAWSPNGWCERPHVDLFSYDVILSADGSVVPEDLSPSLLKLGVLPDGFIVQNVTGIRTHIVRRLDGNGYDIRKLGHYNVRAGHVVYFNDSSLFAYLDSFQNTAKHLDVLLRFYAEDVDSLVEVQTVKSVDTSKDLQQALLVAHTAQFGGDLTTKRHSDPNGLRFAHQDGVHVYMDAENPMGCGPYRYLHPHTALVVHRGECTFLEKLMHARDASAAGIIVISDDDLVINPTANADEIRTAGDLNDTALVLLPQPAGEILLEMMHRAEQGIISRVKMVLEEETIDIPAKDPNRILYINGHPLRNTRLWA